LTKLFPNRAEPFSSPFNRQQFRALAEYCDVEVVAAIPYFPGAHRFKRWSAAGRLMDVPSEECIDDMLVHHPRFFYIPKVALALAGPLYAGSVLPSIWKLRDKASVLLGSWAYPDGYAAVMLGRLLGLPVVVKLHGSDMNVIAKMPAARRMLSHALPRATRIVAVSGPLRAEAIGLGVHPDRIDVVPNGVDRQLFHPRPQNEAREALGLGAGGLVLYVGRLERAKGVIDLIRAFAALQCRYPACRLVLVGEGGARDECQGLVQQLSVPVELVGARPLTEIPQWVAAADVVTLPSYNEGHPNVILEALASGRRVVATRVGAIDEIVRSPLFGELCNPGNVADLSAALDRALCADYDPEQISRESGVIDWDNSALQLYQSLERAVTGSVPKLELDVREAA
jgi:glycosyltransferase involved in cell wall biosynthesis